VGASRWQPDRHGGFRSAAGQPSLQHAAGARRSTLHCRDHFEVHGAVGLPVLPRGGACDMDRSNTLLQVPCSAAE
jgi:hypothetical protein